jgi:Protein of unknown function (DUF2628)
MAIYTVHQPPLKRDEERRGPDRFLFVRDGFYFWAFVFGPIWMLYRRLWLVLIGYVVVAAVMHVCLFLLGAPPGAMVAAQFLLAILIGLEAGTLRRWTLHRRGWRNLGVVAAHRAEEAERRFFDTWEGDEPAAPMSKPFLPATSPLARRRDSSDDIVGLFPEPRAQR